MPDFTQAYLRRIGLDRIPAGIEGLQLLQSMQMKAIPFENIDPLLGRIPSIAQTEVERKTVISGRGGYCFELNALAGAALEEFGFQARTILARVRNGNPQGGARMHQAFVVEEAGRRWLFDTGFGGPGPIAPIDLDDEAPQAFANGTYRTRFDEAAGETVLERQQADGWFALYGFDEDSVRAIDLDAANHLAATWPNSPFTRHLMMSRHGGGSRTTLFNRRFQGAGEARLLEGPDELRSVLVEHFGIELSPEDISALWAIIEHAPTTRPG